MRCLISLGLAILLSSCATSNANNYTQTVQNWRGGNVATLIQQWGTPDVKTPGSKGNTVYVYKTTSYSNANTPTAPVVGINASGNKPVFVTPPNTNNTWTRGPMSLSCLASFIVNSKGTIVDTHIEGNGCYGDVKANPGHSS